MSTQRQTSKIEAWQRELSGQSPQTVLAWAARRFGERLCLASSLGMEDQVLTDMVCRTGLGLSIFTLDTGRLFQETYELLARTEERYGIRLRVMFPDAGEVERMVAERGINLFYHSVENRQLCCRVRKVLPLRRALAGMAAWVCGLRNEQSEKRAATKVVEWDDGNGLWRLNPLVDWTDEQLREYVKQYDVPISPLHARGFVSIGCACCTQAIRPGECFRAGRWWWEEDEHKECGLHWVDGKLVRPGSTGQEGGVA